MSERVYNLIVRVILIGLVVGMLGMIQPFSLAIFKPAFLVLFYCTMGYIVFSHITPRPAKNDQEKAMTNETETAPGEIEASKQP